MNKGQHRSLLLKETSLGWSSLAPYFLHCVKWFGFQLHQMTTGSLRVLVFFSLLVFVQERVAHLDELRVHFQNENTSVCMCVYVCISVPNHMLHICCSVHHKDYYGAQETDLRSQKVQIYLSECPNPQLKTQRSDSPVDSPLLNLMYVLRIQQFRHRSVFGTAGQEVLRLQLCVQYTEKLLTGTRSAC